MAGMATDLHLSGIKYNLCAAVFFVCLPFLRFKPNVSKSVDFARYRTASSRFRRTLSGLKLFGLLT